jgi:hypothetical protein
VLDDPTIPVSDKYPNAIQETPEAEEELEDEEESAW